MANEITVTGSLAVTNGTYVRRWQPSSFQVTQTNKGGSDITFNVGTSAETLAFAEVGTYGWIGVTNLDATNFVTLGSTDAGALQLRVEAGESMAFRLEPGTTFEAKADTAAVELSCFLLED